MKVIVNGRASEFDTEATVGDVVASVTEIPAGRGLAVALNGEVLPRHRWGDTGIDDGDRIEILRAVGGG